MNAGFWVAAIRPPTVPAGSCAAAHHAVGGAPRAGRRCAGRNPGRPVARTERRLSPAHTPPVLYSESNTRERDGSGRLADPLVLLHGWGMNLRVFDRLRAPSAQHHRVTAIDLPGHGRSAWTPNASAQQQLAALAATLPRGATLVGWSLGGQFALQLAAQPALAVRRAGADRDQPAFRARAGLAARIGQRDAAAVCRAARDRCRVRPSPILSSCWCAAASMPPRCARRCSDRCSSTAWPQPEALRAGLALLEQNDLRELARRIDVPALLIAGEYDRVTPPQAARPSRGCCRAGSCCRSGAPGMRRSCRIPRKSARRCSRSRAAKRGARHERAAAARAATDRAGACAVRARPAGAGPLLRSCRGAATTRPRSCSSGCAPSCSSGCSYFALRPQCILDLGAGTCQASRGVAPPLRARARDRAGHRAGHAQGLAAPGVAAAAIRARLRRRLRAAAGQRAASS